MLNSSKTEWLPTAFVLGLIFTHLCRSGVVLLNSAGLDSRLQVKFRSVPQPYSVYIGPLLLLVGGKRASNKTKPRKHISNFCSLIISSHLFHWPSQGTRPSPKFLCRMHLSRRQTMSKEVRERTAIYHQNIILFDRNVTFITTKQSPS